MNLTGLASLGLAAVILPIGVVILAIVAVAGGRSEPDPDGERPAALYLTAVSFVTGFALLFAVFGLAQGLLNLTVTHSDATSAVARSGTFGPNGFSTVSPAAPLIPVGNNQHDGDYRLIVESLVALMVAGGLFLLHQQWLSRWRAKAARGPGLHVWRTYLYVVCFFALVVFLLAVGDLLYAIFRFAAPGITGTDTRGQGVVDFFTAAVLGMGASALFLWHWNDGPLADAVGWRWPKPRPPAPAPVAAPPVVPPPVVPPPVAPPPVAPPPAAPPPPPPPPPPA